MCVSFRLFFDCLCFAFLPFPIASVADQVRALTRHAAPAHCECRPVGMDDRRIDDNTGASPTLDYRLGPLPSSTSEKRGRDEWNLQLKANMGQNDRDIMLKCPRHGKQIKSHCCSLFHATCTVDHAGSLSHGGDAGPSSSPTVSVSDQPRWVSGFSQTAHRMRPEDNGSRSGRTRNSTELRVRHGRT